VIAATAAAADGLPPVLVSTGELITVATIATIAAATIATIATIAAIAAATIATIATIAAIAAATVAAIASAIDTARRRKAAGRRRRRKAAGRRSIDLAAAGSVIATPVISAATPATHRIIALCLGERGDGGSSECEGRREHDDWPAEFQHHDTSPR
jgi:hypothetical protein